MREIHRPVHSGFETLRHRRDPLRRDAQYNRRANPANEQITALGFATSRRPVGLFGESFSR